MFLIELIKALLWYSWIVISKKCEILKEGVILVIKYFPKSLDVVKTSKEIVNCLKNAIILEKSFLVTNQQQYDDSIYTIAFLVSFRSEIGFVKEEYEMLSINEKNIETIDYKEVRDKLILKLSEIMDRYEISEISSMVIKVF